ncbi:hypothetical protein [Candidatus Berkiella aquae]|nr:hypothetical protein [Candidatus Berkiella aquae]MCS5712308.1 hypothetical protein [Candidatus Berkiella aquae]
MMYNQYLKTLVIFIILFALPICGNWLFLYNSGELLPVEEIAHKQCVNNQQCIVGLATRNQGYYYKKALYQETKPKVLILGSSRVMQFRKAFFSQSMINAGGAMNSINEGLSFLRDVLKESTPEAVIIGLDYWWFNQNALEPSLAVKPPPKLSHTLTLRSYLLPYKWLWQQKITLGQYVQRMNPLYSFLEHAEYGIGVDGIFYQNGFAEDGSYVYTKTITGREKNIDDKFELSFTSMAQNGPRFEYGDSIDATHFEQFKEIVKLLEGNKIKVYFFIAPLAPRIANKMDEYQKEYAFIATLRSTLTAAGISFMDFHHPDLIGATDCEFIDGIHGGDLVYAKILRSLAATHPTLNAYVDHQYLTQVTHYYRDIAMIPPQNVQQTEIDFLHLGCDKSTQYVSLRS